MSGPLLPGESSAPQGPMPTHWRLHRLEQMVARLAVEARDLGCSNQLPPTPRGAAAELANNLEEFAAELEEWRRPSSTAEMLVVERWLSALCHSNAVAEITAQALDELPADSREAVAFSALLSMLQGH